MYFPPVDSANCDGLLLLGGELSPAWLLEAYSRGIFPWPVFDGIRDRLAWFSPDPRAILPLERFHVSRRLMRRIRGQKYRLSRDTAFRQVIEACAQTRPDQEGTWITPEMVEAYSGLHRLGYTHSVEVWEAERLVGGIYGVAIGGYFAGESMFHRVTDGSKIALAHLVDHLRERQFTLLDIQQQSPHLARMGAIEIPRSEFLRRLEQALEVPARW